MKDIREFFDIEMQATKQSAGVSFSRTNARPLDSTSVFETFAAASSYAKLNATAYPGQIVAAYDAGSNSMAAYILDPSSDTGLTKFASGGSTEELLEKINAEIEARKANDTYLSGEITTIVGTTLPELSRQLTTDLSVTMTTAEGSSDILKTYTLKQGSTTIGAIDIPRDFLVKSASVKTCTTQDVPVSGYKVGDKYIDFVLNTKEGTAEDQHLYVLVSDLVDNYEGGSTTTIDVSIDKDTNIITANVKAGSISRALLSTDVTNELDALRTDINSVSSDLNTVSSDLNTVSSDLDDEIARATAKENAISSDIDTKVAALNAKDTELQKAIESEAATARAAEAANSSAITAETTRAKNEESRLSGLIQAEITNRANADSTLQGNIDNLSVALDGKITAEKTARETADRALDERLGAAETAIAAHGLTITGHGTTIAANTAAIAAETTRATNVENELSGKITSLSTGYVTKAELQAEEDARIANDKVLSNAITSIVDDYLTSEDKTLLEGKITAEKNRAEGVEAGLAATLKTVSSDYETATNATSKYNTLTGLIDTEEAARIANDQVLSNAITSITTTYETKAEASASHQALKQSIEAEAKARAEADAALETKLTVTVEKQGTAESGYLATYVVKQNGSQVGSKINIPKDFVVKNASVKNCAEKDKPVSGLNVGDKYIDLEINTVDETATSTHIYLPIKDMVDAYSGATTTTVKVEIGNDNSISASVLDGSISYSKLSSDITGKFDALSVTDEGLRTDVDQVSSDLNAEITRATAAEKANADAIKAEAKRADAAEQYLSGEIDNKVYVKNGSETFGQLSVIKISKAEFDDKVGSGSPLRGNVLYVVDSNVIDAYGQQMKNLAAPTDPGDATNKKYVDDSLTATAHALSTDYNAKIGAITSDNKSVVKHVELNGLAFDIKDNKATLNIDVISCGTAS